MIESLESRIAPAAILTFFETDGDKITIKTNKGTNADLVAATGINKGATDINEFTIDLIKTPALSATFAGTNVSVTASGGTGQTKNQANFVKINGFDGSGNPPIDLGKVTVKGQLVYIDAGDGDITTKAIKKLIVTNWGPDFGSTVATASEIHGDIGSILVKKSFNGEIVSEDALQVANFQTDEGTIIGSFVVGDDIASLNGNNVGHIQVHEIGRLVVKDRFFGSTDGSVNNGVIEATAINRINIFRMTFNASIVLS